MSAKATVTPVNFEMDSRPAKVNTPAMAAETKMVYICGGNLK